MRNLKWLGYLGLLVVAFSVGLVGTISASAKISPAQLLGAPAQDAAAPAAPARPLTVEC